LSLLQELGYLYHIDDISRDEPFIEQVNGTDFVVVPYTLRNNDILLIVAELLAGAISGADQVGLRPALRRSRQPAPYYVGQRA